MASYQIALRTLAACAGLLFLTSAEAVQVTWRASGTVTSVGQNSLPFTVNVGDPVTLDEVLELDSTLVTGGPTSATEASYDNLFSAVLTVGNNEMTLTPSRPWTTTMWDGFQVGNSLYDYYFSPVVDAKTDWEAAWVVQTPVPSGQEGPIPALGILQAPPDPSQFQTKEITMTPGGGSPYAPAFTASLDSIAEVGSNTPPPAAGGHGGGGALDLLTLVALMLTAVSSFISSCSVSTRPVETFSATEQLRGLTSGA